MLVLNRRLNESIVIANDIVVTVVGIHGNQVRLGITAPREVVVNREEVHQRKLAEFSPPAKHPSPLTGERRSSRKHSAPVSDLLSQVRSQGD
jgi:carbon storage regulator